MSRLIRVLLLSVFLSSFASNPVAAQTPAPSSAARAILNLMTPEERVGQLFLVSFNGANADADSQIYDLIVHRHVGGVVLSAQNNNFSETDTLNQTRQLIGALQQIEWNASVAPTENSARSIYAPLFIGVSQEGNGAPADQILNGLTPLPSQMALGATWNAELSEKVGEILGAEISALGFNLLMGPSLDVLEAPNVGGGDLGTRVFGGDPYWVGKLAKAYVGGLHNGSNHKLLVVAKHFPGAGGADRLPQEEVATVRKSFEQLKQVEFAPFFAITGNADDPEEVADGLLVSHIRYQGFQGNIRATTRPVSFDSQALSQILALPEFSTWYAENGLLISDDLGSPAVREFYLTSGNLFQARVAARDAFLAGNDLLYLGNIKGDDAPDSYVSVTRTIDFFTQKYREDPAFAQRVDNSAERILTAKFKVYKNFALGNVIAAASAPIRPENADVVFQAARNSATLVSPSQQDLASILPAPPRSTSRIVFITDTISAAQCASCAPQPILATDTLQNVVLRLYGPKSGNQIESARLRSYSFDDLKNWLDSPDQDPLADSLVSADWVVFSVADATHGQPALLSRLFRERPAALLNKTLILFSFDAPYYFDATALSRFTAYYALYSKQSPFIDVAARLLFQEIAPSGSSPVSIPAIGYDLMDITSPNPNQIISLSLDLPPVVATPQVGITPEPTLAPLFSIGDTISLRTGVIKDHNGNQVPDGTIAQFSMLLTGEGGGILQQVKAATMDGIARAAFGLDKPGLLEIRVVSESALISDALKLDVSQTGKVAVTVVSPELTQPAPSTPTPAATALPDLFVAQDGHPLISAWTVAMFLILLSSGALFVIMSRFTTRRIALRLALGMLLGGLLAYNLLVLGAFNLSAWLLEEKLRGVISATLVGQALGLAGGWLWSRSNK